MSVVITHLGYGEEPGYGEWPYASGVGIGSLAMQALQIKGFVLAMQAFAQAYNAINLRILADFSSRGVSGSNWTASSTASGDFATSNLNTDIVEQYWRTAGSVFSGVTLTCDTQLTQGALVDTVAVLNHNLSTSATVTLLGSNSSTFASIGVSIPMQVTTENMYWIAADAPTQTYRYWRFVIDDPQNADSFISIGTILFGRAEVFQGEFHTDEVQFSYRDFVDTVQTEGFTNVSNSRALKKVLGLQFRLLRFHLGNFAILRRLSTTYRTTHKLLWIPTPDADDMNVTGRFAVYGKLSAIPSETHNYKGGNADYVSLSVEIDESR